MSLTGHRARLGAAGLLLAAVLAPAAARADASPTFYWENLYVPFGLNVGGSIHPTLSSGFLLGGEISVVNVTEPKSGHPDFLSWGGFLAFDHDFGTGAHRLAFGPEAAWEMVGLEAGFVRQFGSSELSGMRLRVYGFFALVTFYVGQTIAFGDVRERTFTEAGALLKLPLCFPTAHSCDWGVPMGIPRRP